MNGGDRNLVRVQVNEERDQLRRLPELVYDIGSVHTVRASNRFRVTFETKRYSVPAEYASARPVLKSYPDRFCIYHRDRLVARHRRSYERHRDFEHRRWITDKWLIEAIRAHRRIERKLSVCVSVSGLDQVSVPETGNVLVTDHAGDGLPERVEPTFLGSARERWFVCPVRPRPLRSGVAA